MSNQRVLRSSALMPRGDPAIAKRSRGVPELWHFAAEYLLGLPVGAAIGLVWANVQPESYFRTVFGLDFFVNELGLVFFFGLVMKEVVEATASGGVLHPWRRAGLPVVAALGATLVPALLLVELAPVFGEPLVAQAWAVTFATDLAFGYFLAIVIFGRHPVLPLFLLLAMSADAFGFIALAPAATASQLQLATLLTLMVAAIGTATVLRRRKTRSFWPYILIGGGLSWSALLFGGIHPALALVPIIPFLPHATRDPGFFVDAPANAHDTLNQFERWCRHPAQVALFLFGLITGGVPLRALDWGTLSMPIAIFVGKPVGVLMGVAFARGLGLYLPYHVGLRHLIVVAFISTIGFTMALFFATVAIGPGAVLSEIKMGALLTLTGGLVALGVARFARVGRFARGER
jgi:Na+:H+ antiporter, NhaA family